jgi:hypothetical protein
MGSISRGLISLVPQVRARSLDVLSHNTRSSGANLGLTVLGRKTGADRFVSATPTPSHFSFSRFGNLLRSPSTFPLMSFLHLRYYRSTMVIYKIIKVFCQPDRAQLLAMPTAESDHHREREDLRPVF